MTPSAFAQQQAASPDQAVRSGSFIQRAPASGIASSNVDFETEQPLSATFVAADVAGVVNQILGDFLKIDYSIAPDVSGLVTMRVDGIQTRLTAIEALRSSLSPLGIAVIDRGDFVAVARGTGQDRPIQAAAIDPGQPSPAGGGVVVLTPRHIRPSQLAPLIAPFAPGSTATLTDDSRRFLILKGDEASISAASTAAAMFDVDWFSQISTASFVLKHVTPDDLIRELTPLLGPAAASIEFVPVPRLSTLIVLSRDPQIVGSVRAWVERLDVTSAEVSAGLLIYHVKHGAADVLAKSLQESGGSDAAPAAPTSPVTTSPTSFPQSPGALPAPPSAGSSSAMTVSSNLSQNIVIVRGNADQIADARALLDALDQQPAQVLIEAAIVEVTLNNELEYGVNWKGIEDRFNATFTDAANGQVASRFPGFALSYVNADITVALNLLSSITKVEVISRPSLMALNNESANLQVGDQVPIVTQTAISVNDPAAPIVNQTVYRDTGVILTVVPRVRSGGMVELEVEQEVSQVARTTSSGIDSPTIQQRKIQSKLLVPSGKSVALGGLISTSHTGGVTGVPILKDIPLIGQLFRTDSRVTARTELIVFMTPHVLMSGDAAVEATDRLRLAFRKLENKLPAP